CRSRHDEPPGSAMLNLTRLHLAIAHESEFQGLGITPLVARQELTHGRDVRQRVRARRSGYCERTQAASPDVLDGRRHCSKAYLSLPREEIGQSRPCATIENVHHINPSHYFEKLAGHMHRRTRGP